MEAELYHHGILGMKWGVRRFQNADGSLTALGFKHRNIRESRFNFNDLKKSAMTFIDNNKNKSFSEIKIDALDYMNQKGLLDLLDANADAPFKAIAQGKGKAGIQQEIIDNYKGKGSDPISFMNKLRRNFEIVSATNAEKAAKPYIWEEVEDYGSIGDWVDRQDDTRGKANSEALKKIGSTDDWGGDKHEKREWDMTIEQPTMRMVDHRSEGGSTSIMYKQDYRDLDQKKFDAAMKKGNFSYEDWGKAVIDATGRNLEDKKLGMISKDARDIERATVGKTFLDSLKTNDDWNTSGDYDVSKLTENWYDREGLHNEYRDFEGKKFDYDSSGRIGSGGSYIPTGTPTREYQEFVKNLGVMPSNYSHVTDTPSHDFVDITAKMFEDKWTMSHSDLTDNFLMHHGIMGMHWGERKYQNKDGSLTEEGRKHYGVGPAREFAKKVGATAKKASETLSSAARKTFRPNEADMNEKLAKAYEKKRIEDKKNQLRELQGKKKRIQDMSNQEVWEEIQARNNRKTLERMRREASALHKGTDFVSKAAGVATTPLKELAGFGLSMAKDTAAYGISRATRSAIDDAVYAASKQRRLENRTELEKLRDDSEINKLKFEERSRGLREQNEIQRMKNNAKLGDVRTEHEAAKLQNEMNRFSSEDQLRDVKTQNERQRIESEMSLREMNNARERTKAERDAAVNFLERQVAMGSETASKYATERLNRIKTNSPGGGNKKDGNKKRR